MRVCAASKCNSPAIAQKCAVACAQGGFEPRISRYEVTNLTAPPQLIVATLDSTACALSFERAQRRTENRNNTGSQDVRS
mmetsp:Transcript_37408/g.76781  ORF Transcript_37408/g.76781 Transcript_37408/m.76781 type:complete len:80 (+) Transcript_37408:337-576(+)